MNTVLPLINIFQEPFIRWERRNLDPQEAINGKYSFEEIRAGVKTGNFISLNNYFESVFYVSKYLGDTMLTCFIESTLAENSVLKSWLREMPSVTPQILKDYQNKYHERDFLEVDVAIRKAMCVLSEGQTLIHGGLWWGKEDVVITNRPLSTTFCPQVALAETLHNAKAYYSDRIDLIILTCTNPQTNVFVYKHKRIQKAHEKEVLFASGARLQKVREIFITSLDVYKDHGSEGKSVPIYAVEVLIT